MNILLTGGTGLIGRALLKHWLPQHHLIVLSRNPSQARARCGPQLTYVSTINEVDFNQLNAIVNLAGEPIADKRWTQAQKHKICHSRWELTEQLSQACTQASTPPAVLINGSAVGYYGRQGEQPISELYTGFYPEFSHDICARWENLANRAASETTRVCLLRTGIVLAEQGGALAKMLPAYKLGLGGPLADGQQYMPWIHIDDVIAIIDFLLLYPECQGPYNVTAPRPVTNEQFSQLLANRLNSKARFRLPAFALRLLFGEMADLLLFGQNAKPERLLQAGFQFSYPTLREALHSLQL